MNKTLFAFIIALICFGNLHAQDTAAIVKSARLIQASPNDKAAATAKTQKMIGNYSYTDSLYSGFLFWIGPRLWDQLKDMEEFKAMHLGNLALSVPTYNKKGKEDGTQQMYGKMIQSPGNFHDFWEFVYSAYNVKGAKIVTPNDRDKFIYWQYYNSYEEPIVVIESDKGRLLLKFTKGSLFFVELTGK
jgi:hypothetical protein